MITEKTILRIGITMAVLYAIKEATRVPCIHYVNHLPGNFNALTIPPFGIYILKKHEGNIGLLNHELVHWEQYQRAGIVFYYLKYLLQYLQYGYDRMPMEVEARFMESDYCKLNYTECVRNNTAVTLYNENFRL